VLLASALPYFTVSFRFGPLQLYAWMLIGGLLLGGLAMVYASRRYALPAGDVIALAGVLVVASFVGAHLFDIVANQLDDAKHDAALWWQLWKGISLLGALATMAIVTFAWARVRDLPLAKLADCVALGWLVALVIGRIGCALVHDHLGTPTTLPIGIDFPPHAVWQLDNDGPMRLHDLGFEELLVAIPLCVVMWLIARRLKPGMTAVLTALVYAPIRFGLDFLRLPEPDVRFAALTGAQWGCIAMTGLAVFSVTRLQRSSG